MQEETSLTFYLNNCSRVVDAGSPKAIVISAKEFSVSVKLREGDISWNKFLERVDTFKYDFLFCIFERQFSLRLCFLSIWNEFLEWSPANIECNQLFSMCHLGLIMRGGCYLLQRG